MTNNFKTTHLRARAQIRAPDDAASKNALENQRESRASRGVAPRGVASYGQTVIIISNLKSSLGFRIRIKSRNQAKTFCFLLEPPHWKSPKTYNPRSFDSLVAPPDHTWRRSINHSSQSLESITRHSSSVAFPRRRPPWRRSSARRRAIARPIDRRHSRSHLAHDGEWSRAYPPRRDRGAIAVRLVSSRRTTTASRARETDGGRSTTNRPSAIANARATRFRFVRAARRAHERSIANDRWLIAKKTR